MVPKEDLIMARIRQPIKIDAIQYYQDHNELGLVGCATNLGISQQTLSR
jgi:transposase